MSRAESGIRKLTQTGRWLATRSTWKTCGYLLDRWHRSAVQLPPVRGTSAIREFFVHMIEGGLGT